MQAAQIKTFNGKDLSYDEYCALLLSAAQQYDQQDAKKGDKTVKRRIYEHKYIHNHRNDKLHDAKSCNIDQSLATIEAHATNFNWGPCLQYKQWHTLPKDVQEAWDALSKEAK